MLPPVIWLIGGVVLLYGLFKKEEEKVKRRVFFSFHFQNDVMRVQQVRNIGAIEGDTKVSKNDWEEVKRKGETSIESWIDNNMNGCSCIVVLIGSETAGRKWVKYEIEKAWRGGKGLVGIYIHNLKCPQNGTSKKGKNPFDFVVDGQRLSDIVECHDPDNLFSSAYNQIAGNINDWANKAVKKFGNKHPLF